MKALLKCIALLAISWLIIVPNSIAQNCIPQSLPSTSSSVAVESKNGYHLPASGTIRILVVLAEINYNVGADPNSPWWSADWQPGQAPLWKNSFLDVNSPSNGRLSKYFNLASSGNYLVLGDFLAPL